MRVPAGYDLGVATRTGLVRSTNEDDYLVVALPPPAGGLLVAIADGMGGVAGGGEASRAALRGLAASLLQGPAGEPAAALAAGFDAASARVYELAQEVAALRDMGTTLTALLLDGGAGTLGHIGDTRALLWRGGELSALTQDHALRQPHNFLTRCIGGGQQREDPDLSPLQLQAGDRLLLLTDGVWSTVPAGGLQQALLLPSPQAAAEVLVQQALRAGGPDNATALVLDFRPGLPPRELALPATEAPRAAGLHLSGQRLRRSRWPIVVLVLAGVAAAAALLRWSDTFDAFAWLRAAMP